MAPLGSINLTKGTSGSSSLENSSTPNFAQTMNPNSEVQVNLTSQTSSYNSTNDYTGNGFSVVVVVGTLAVIAVVVAIQDAVVVATIVSPMFSAQYVTRLDMVHGFVIIVLMRTMCQLFLHPCPLFHGLLLLFPHSRFSMHNLFSTWFHPLIMLNLFIMLLNPGMLTFNLHQRLFKLQNNQPTLRFF